jgi:hypothetical protein
MKEDYKAGACVILNTLKSTLQGKLSPTSYEAFNVC